MPPRRAGGDGGQLLRGAHGRSLPRARGAPFRLHGRVHRGARRKGPSDPPHILSADPPGRVRRARPYRGDSFLSFFDEDDEPRTRVRPRRTASARGSAGPPDRQQVLIRQISLLVGALLVLGLLLFVVDGCRDSARENALKDYNRAVGSIVSDSDSQVGKPFFDLLRNPGTGDLEAQVASYMSQAETQFQQAKRIDTPGDMIAAQRSFLETMEMRRDGLKSIADQVRTALGSNAEAADTAIRNITGAMQLFLASDVIYTTRVLPRIEAELKDADVGAPAAPADPVLPGRRSGSTRPRSPTRSARSCPRAGTAARRPRAGARPARHRDRLGPGGRPDARSPTPPTGSPTAPDTEFTVNFTNQGENDEVDVDVVAADRGRAQAAPGRAHRRVGRRGRLGVARRSRSTRRRRSTRRSRSPSRSRRCRARRRRTTTSRRTTPCSRRGSAPAPVSWGGVDELTDPAGIAALSAGARRADRAAVDVRPRRSGCGGCARAQQAVLGPAGRDDLVAPRRAAPGGVHAARRPRRGGRRAARGADGERRGAARRRDRLPRARPLRRLRRAVRPPVGVARAARRGAQRRRALLDRAPRHGAAVLQAGASTAAGEHLLSPEEDEAIRRALAGERGTAVLED